MRYRNARRLAGLSLALGILATACSATASPTGEEATPVSGGTLTVALATQPGCMDSQVSQQGVTNTINRNVLDSLVSQDGSGGYHPWLAASWDISPDLTRYTFHLRHDVTFTDGTAFDAEAVKTNFARIVAPATRSQFAAGLLGPYAGTDVVDRYTVAVRFTKPFAPFLAAAATPNLGFYSPKALAERGGELCGGGPAAVGTGPFTFTSFGKGQGAVLTRNPAYRWAPATAAHPGPAYLDEIDFRFLPEESVRVGTLTSGQVDVALAVPPSNIATLRDTPSVRILQRDVPGSGYNLYLNTAIAPLDDQRVRNAVQRATDLDADVRTVFFGQYNRAWSPLSPSTVGYDKAAEHSWPFDPGMADHLLDSAGWTGRDGAGYRTRNGVRLTIDWPALPADYTTNGNATLAQAVQADLKQVGIELTRTPYDIGTYLRKIHAGQLAAADAGWSATDPDLLRLFFNSADDPAHGGQNVTRFDDPELDAWTSAAAATLDPARRSDLYRKVQARVLELGLVVPLYTPSTVVGTGSRVQGIGFDAAAQPAFFDAWVAG
ncbi:ABC transporter substrate-binding protein [Amycolatopsis ultiminotia]|uniref:ABC transporter substrate-binding protein n=1 Tax=Amycolatopsis ultiminotia TaxID=543629 RepID=A0ABP6XHJ8_9PSEU